MNVKQYLQLLKEQAGSKEMGDIHAEVIKFFMSNPNPSDKEVHEHAEELGMNHDEFERHVYMILGNILTGGKSGKFKGSYDPKQLEKGTKVEMEHTSEPLVAEKIAKDHLAEIPDYYDRLEKMEKAAGVVHEIFHKVPIGKSIPPGPDKDKEILRTSIIAEYDAINLYEQMANEATFMPLKQVLLDVAAEEKEHVGEFESLLEYIDQQHEELVEKGEDEVEELTGLDSED